MNADLPMLPRIGFPGPPRIKAFASTLMEGILAGDIEWGEARCFFDIPGVGFHQSGFLLLCHTVGYRADGSHTVAIPPSMQEALGNTSLAGVEPIDFKMPHQTMYFSLPNSKFQLWGGPTGWHACSGVYLSEVYRDDDTDNELTGLKVYLWGAENEKSREEGDDASFWFHIDLEEMRANKWDFDTYIKSILSDEDREIKMRVITVGPDPNGGLREVGNEPMGMADQGHIKDVHQLTRLVLNTVLYLTSADAIIEEDAGSQAFLKEASSLENAYKRIKNKSKGKARRLAKRLGEIPKDRILWIGSRSEAMPKYSAEGSWWPRKDILRAKLVAMRDDPEAEERSARLEEAEAKMKEATGVEDIAECVREIREHRKWFADKMTHAEGLAGSLHATRRWIQPRKAKGG